MQLTTTRFGFVEYHARDIIRLEEGLIGFESLKCWLLLADSSTSSVGWLQSVERSDVAFAIVNPKDHVSSYRVKVSRREVEPLGLNSEDQLHVWSIVSKHHGTLTINLRAPILANLRTGVARQVITLDEQPVQRALPSLPVSFRKSA